MVRLELVEKTIEFFRDIEKKDWSALIHMLTDDFLFYGPMPDPIDRETWLEFEQAIRKAFPDWHYNIRMVEERGLEVHVKVQITGTHKKALSLPKLGIPDVPPTGNAIKLPVEHSILQYREDGKVKALRVEKAFHGGLPGLLEQLGVE